MKIVIAAAGEGTRMWPITEEKPKHLIDVRGRPFLGFVFDNVLRAGFRELILVVGYKAEKFSQFLENYSAPEGIKNSDYKVEVINQFDILGEAKSKGERGKYGTACPLMCIKDIVNEENFVMIFGDNLYSVQDLKEFKINDDINYVGGVEHEHPEKYGVLISNNGFLKKIIEKPKKPRVNLITTGLYKFTSEVFNKIQEIKKSPRGEYEITDIVALLAKERKVKVRKLKGYWLDFGSPEDIKKVSKLLDKNENFKSPAKKSISNSNYS